MKKHVVFIFLTVIYVIGCSSPDSQKISTKITASDSLVKTESFFPVTDFIGGQIKMIDSLQLPLTKTITVNKNTKMEPVSDQEFRLLARNFQQPDINDSSIRKFYKESSIADQSIPSVTLTYSATDTSLPVQKINVFIKPDLVKNDKVTGIYIEKLFTSKDTVFSQKLYWKTGKNFQVVTEKRTRSKLLPTEQIKVIWDPVD
jgi:hypothetical protein